MFLFFSFLLYVQVYVGVGVEEKLKEERVQMTMMDHTATPTVPYRLLVKFSTKNFTSKIS